MNVFAPGKLFVIGEYAVLEGGDAVVAAVNHGVRCRVMPGDGVRAPGGDTRFVQPALQAVDAPPRLYDFAAWNPLNFPHKVGLGSSAAACVAAVGAGLLAQGKQPAPSDLSIALQTHRAVQGSGSGRDVMASFYGGLSRFSDGGREELSPLPLSVLHSGQPAATGPRVEAYLRLAHRSDFLKEALVLLDGFDSDPVQALDAYGALVETMAQSAGFEYLTPAHRRIRQLARGFGGAAKPSGAGGGDIAVALIPHEENRASFLAACQKDALLEVPVRLSCGLHWKTENA
ncbi:MAG: hypothetical protein VXW32_07065 [Myxococcota bacterium]|nr:hypothetical protein [Myxococcota bacterium]